MSAFKAPPFLDGTFDKLQTSWQDSTMPTLNFRQILTKLQFRNVHDFPIPCFYGNDAHALTVVPRPFFHRSRKNGLGTGLGICACSSTAARLWTTERQLESLVKQTVVAYVCSKKNGRRPISTVKMKAQRSCSLPS